MTRYAIGLGSNEGDRLSNLRMAVEGLGFAEVQLLSGLYETEPMGGPAQDPYLNAVALVETPLEPHQLLARLQAIEEAAGRVRTVKWGPRTLDLDIISWDGPPFSDERLVIPHPRAGEREFVLRPLAQVWPEATLNGGVTAAAALERAPAQGVDLLTASWAVESPNWAGTVFVAAQFVWFLAIALAMAWDGTMPEGSADTVRVAGAVLAAIGAILAFVSSRRLGPAMTALPEPRAGGALIMSGPYALARHPIYGGVTLFILGTSMIVDSLLGSALSLGLLPFFYLKSEYEERRLRIRYPGYRDYRQRVTRRLIPFVI